MGNRLSDSWIHSVLTQAKMWRRGASAFVLLVTVSLAASPPVETRTGAPAPGPATYGSFAATSRQSHTNGDNQQTEPTQTVVYRPTTTTSSCSFGSGFLPSGGGGASEARAKLLDKNGPQLPRVFNMSSFSVMGFVKGNWPVVFDYQLERDSLLIVVIAPEGQQPIIYRLNGKAGHWQNKLSVPAGVGTESVVAHYTLQSMDEGVGQLGPSHLHVHGVAAGPRRSVPLGSTR